MIELTHHKTSEKQTFPELIDLQSANVQVIKKTGDITKWNVRKNVTGESLQTFQVNITEEFMFSILNFARKFELIAFNAGIKTQKNKQNELLKEKIVVLSNINKELAFENERLARILEQVTSKV